MGKYTNNPPPRPITPHNTKSIHDQFNELYKTIYPLWERLGGYEENLHEGTYQVNLTKGNIGNQDTILLQYEVKAAELDTYLFIEGFGNFGATTNNKRIRLFFGSSLLLDTGILPFNSGSWSVRSQIFRVSSSSQKSNSIIISDSAFLNGKASVTSLTENLQHPLVVKFVGNGVATNDVVQEGMITNLL